MKEKIKSCGLILLGLVLTAMAISLFFVPNKIVNGGSSGLSTPSRSLAKDSIFTGKQKSKIFNIQGDITL